MMRAYKHLRHILFIGFLILGSFGIALTASAQSKPQSVTVQVRSIAASKSGDSFDSKLNDLRGRLQKGFSGYTNFSEVGKTSFTIRLNQSHSMSLVNGSTMEMTYRGQTGKHYQLGLAIGNQLNTTLRASPRSTFFQAGMNYRDGILILAISVQ